MGTNRCFSIRVSLRFILVMGCIASGYSLQAQSVAVNESQRKGLTAVIAQYAEARERKDTILLKKILTGDIDQLVSSGEWRTGIKAAIEGMMRSSEANAGKRSLIVEKIRLLSPDHAIVDARYEIGNQDGTQRKMWSTFFIVSTPEGWKISAIRNMLPSSPR